MRHLLAATPPQLSPGVFLYKIYGIPVCTGVLEGPVLHSGPATQCQARSTMRAAAVPVPALPRVDSQTPRELHLRR